MQIKRFLSLILAIVMIVTSFVTVTAETTDLTPVSNDTDSFVFDEDSGKNQAETLVLPDIIKQDGTVTDKFVSRLQSEEKNLHTFVFRNNDGTNTKKIYFYPVKYIDAAGAVKDITTKPGKRILPIL